MRQFRSVDELAQEVAESAGGGQAMRQRTTVPAQEKSSVRHYRMEAGDIDGDKFTLGWANVHDGRIVASAWRKYHRQPLWKLVKWLEDNYGSSRCSELTLSAKVREGR